MKHQPIIISFTEEQLDKLKPFINRVTDKIGSDIKFLTLGYAWFYTPDPKGSENFAKFSLIEGKEAEKLAKKINKYLRKIK